MHTRAEDREREFLAYIDSTAGYNAAIVERGGIPWHDGDIERRRALARQLGIAADASGLDFRRALFMRRYQRPEPPKDLAPIKSIKSYQRKQTDEATAQRAEGVHATCTSPTEQAA